MSVCKKFEADKTLKRGALSKGNQWYISVLWSVCVYARNMFKWKNPDNDFIAENLFKTYIELTFCKECLLGASFAWLELNTYCIWVVTSSGEWWKNAFHLLGYRDIYKKRRFENLVFALLPQALTMNYWKIFM